MGVNIQLLKSGASLGIEEGGEAYFGSPEFADRFPGYTVVDGVSGYRKLVMRDGEIYVQNEEGEEMEVRAPAGDSFIPLEPGKKEGTSIVLLARITPQQNVPSGKYVFPFNPEEVDERLKGLFGDEEETRH